MVLEAVRQIVRDIDDLSSSAGSLGDNSSLYDAGLSSYGTVDLMIALETRFGIAFPDELLTRDTFETIGSIAAIVTQLRSTAAADAAGAPATAGVKGHLIALDARS